MDSNDDNKPARQGCLISYRELLESLNHLGADRDEEGKYMIHPCGENPMLPQFFLGIESLDNDVLVDDSCYVTVNGEKKTLFQVASRHGRGINVIPIY